MLNIPGRDLHDFITKEREIDVKSVMKGIMTGLMHMNQISIAHRDIKPENIMPGPPVKLIDFGYATFFDRNLPRRERMKGLAGTEFYLAPEVRNHQSYDESVDCFSAGIALMFVTLFSKNDGEKILCEIFNPVNKEDVDTDTFQKDMSRVPKDIRPFLNRILRVPGYERPVAADILIRDPWLTQI